MAAMLPFLTIAGAAMSAIGALQQGQSAKQAGEYNSAVAQRNATVARQQAAADAETHQRNSARTIGLMRAGYGSNGLSLEGSPLDVLSSSAAAAELDRQAILYKGELKSIGFESTAQLETMSGESAETNSYFSAGAGAASILTGTKRSTKTATTGNQIGDFYDSTWNLS